MLAEHEGVEPRRQVVPALHPESESQDQLQQGQCRDGGGTDAHLFCGPVKCPLKHQELLVFGGPIQGLPDVGKILGVGDLHQVKQVGGVFPEVFCCALALLSFIDALVFQVRLP